MSTDWYQVVALGARYWFALLGVVIVWHALRWQLGDSRRRKQVLRNLPDAGYIGTLYVLEGESDAFDEGDSINIPAEGVLGSAMGCDVFVPHPSVSARHMLFHLFPDGLHVRAYRDQVLIVDGETLAPGEQAILRHGAILTVGTVVLQLRLFVGVTVKDALVGDPPPPPSQEKGFPFFRKKKKQDGEGDEEAAPAAKAKKRGKGGRKPAAPEQPPEEDWAEDAPYDEAYYDDEYDDYDEDEAPWSTHTWGNPFDEDDDQYG